MRYKKKPHTTTVKYKSSYAQRTERHRDTEKSTRRERDIERGDGKVKE